MTIMATRTDDIRAVRLAEHVAQTVASFPPLTVEQRDHVAVLLRPAGDD